MIRRWLLVALDAVPWSEHLELAATLDEALLEIMRLEDEAAQARESYAALRSLWLPEDEVPTVVGMLPMVGEEVVR